MKRKEYTPAKYFKFSYKLIVLISGIAFIFYACSDSGTDAYGGGNGSGNTNGNGNGGGSTEIGTQPTFDNVLQIFTTNCTGCHTGTATNGVRLDSYQFVIESVGQQYGKLVVNPGNSNESPLIDKIESDDPQFGERMPQGGPYLSGQRINQIKEWIDNGANNNQSDENDNGSGNGNGNGGY